MREQEQELFWAKHREAMTRKGPEVTLHVDSKNALILADFASDLLRHEHKMKRTLDIADPQDPFDGLVLNVNRLTVGNKGGDLRLTRKRIEAAKTKLGAFIIEKGFSEEGVDGQAMLVLMTKLEAAFEKGSKKPGIVHEFNISDHLPKAPKPSGVQHNFIGRAVMRVRRRG
ncbi:MAG: hypothetical protein ACM3IJ_03945, partial [Candidatus Levyibacteriota bacterium]